MRSVCPPRASLKMFGNGKGGTVFFCQPKLYIMNNEVNANLSVDSVSIVGKNVKHEQFFLEAAQRVKDAFPVDYVDNELLYLHGRLKYMKLLSARLELPWEKYIPILYGGFMQYLQHVNESTRRTRVINLTTELMDFVAFMSQSKNQIHNITVYLNQQVMDLEKLIKDLEEERNLLVTEND